MSLFPLGVRTEILPASSTITMAASVSGVLRERRAWWWCVWWSGLVEAVVEWCRELREVVSESESESGRRWRLRRGMVLSSPAGPPPAAEVAVVVLRGWEDDGAVSSEVLLVLLVVLSREVTQWITVALKRTGGEFSWERSERGSRETYCPSCST